MKLIDGVTKAVDAKNSTVEAVISSILPDRSAEIVLPSSFSAHLDTYWKNPVLLWGHAAACEELTGPENCVGKAVDIKIGENDVTAIFEYAVKHNPQAKLIFDLVSNGYLRSYSVGFLPIKAVWFDEDLSGLPDSVQLAMARGEAYRCYTESELLEVSQCFIGANRESLVKAFRDGVLNRKELDHILHGKSLPKIYPVATKIAADSIDVRAIEETVFGRVMKRIEAQEAAQEAQKSVDALTARLQSLLK